MIRQIYVIGLFLTSNLFAQDPTSIFWDQWGVPHIYAKTEKELFFSFAYAQMKSHGPLILKLYGKSRGSAAAYWGESYIESDILIHTLGFPDRAIDFLGKQPKSFKENLEAFANGINVYVNQSGDEFSEDLKKVLPIVPEDILSHYLYGMYMQFISSGELNGIRTWEPGSNAYAVSPQKTISNQSILMANPHLPWKDEFLFYEAHLVLPKLNLYGATLVGLPVLTIAFNEKLGWTHTVNTADMADLYELKLTESNGYEIDGASKNFVRKIRSIQYESESEGRKSKSFDVLESIHGPVIMKKNNSAISIRISGLNKALGLYQWWRMASSADIEEFESVIYDLQMPFFNIIYADSDGNIFYHFNGVIPKRPTGDYAFWKNILPGNQSYLVWKDAHTYDDLPKIMNPASGWIHNANDPPWTSTIPQELDPSDYPDYLSPNIMDFRAQSSAKLLKDAGNYINLDRLVQIKMSTKSELAERLIPDLNEALQQKKFGRAMQALDFLNQWNKSFEPNSDGTIIFIKWYEKYKSLCQDNGIFPFKEGWDPNDPLQTPRGLSDYDLAAKALDDVAVDLVMTYRKLSVPYNQEYFLKYGNNLLGASGGDGKWGLMKVLQFQKGENGENVSFFGDSYIAITEFGPKIKAKVLLPYGNSSRQDSKHYGDQLELYQKSQMRDAYFYEEDVKMHATKRDLLVNGYFISEN
jgi:acyl-homoserine-lactone acylase